MDVAFLDKDMNKIIIFLKFSESYCHANWKTTAKLITYVSEVYLKILRSNYLQFSSYTREVCYSFKSNLLFNSCFFFLFFFVFKQIFTAHWFKNIQIHNFKALLLSSSNHVFIVMLFLWLSLEKYYSLDEYQFHFNVFI